ncbi:MAG: type II CAAX endopeptidase family protein [Clostridia bacterium]|nr:type II CAAX endopeptidase family protein [Clostridia bacterium]
MKFKKLSHVLIFCFSLILFSWAVGNGLYFLTITIFSEKSTYLKYLAGINNFMSALIGILILKKLGKINILKDKGKGFWRGIFIGSIPLVFITFFIAYDILVAEDIRLQSWEVIMSIIFQCFSVGVLEEIYFRGIIFNVIDDYFGHKNACDIWKTVVLSGFLFGFAHLDFFKGMSGFLSSIGQFIGCIAIGILFGAVYMRYRNIYSLMFVHALYDIVGIWQRFIVGNIGSYQVSNLLIIAIIQFIMYILVVVFLLRKKKMAEIINSEPNKSSLDPKYS